MSNSNLPSILLGSEYTDGVSNLTDDLHSDLIEVAVTSQEITYTYGSNANGYFFDIEVDTVRVSRSQYRDYIAGVFNPTLTMPLQMLDDSDVATTDFDVTGIITNLGAVASASVDPAKKTSTTVSIKLKRLNNGADVSWNFNYNSQWSIG